MTHVCHSKTFVMTKMILVAAPANDSIVQSPSFSFAYDGVVHCGHGLEGDGLVGKTQLGRLKGMGVFDLRPLVLWTANCPIMHSALAVFNCFKTRHRK